MALPRIPRKQLDSELIAGSDTATISALHTYTVNPKCSDTPSTAQHLTNKTYVDNMLQSGASAYLSAPQAVSTGSFQTVVFDTEVSDTLSEFNVSTGKFTVTTAGRYLICTTVGFAADSSGVRAIAVYKNGSVYIHGPLVDAISGSPGNELILNMSCIVYSDADDILDIRVYQDSGSSVNTTSGQDEACVQVQRLF